MGEMIAFCGLDCNECPALIATQKDSDDERRRVAELWSKQFNANIKPEDINCDGCFSDTGRLFSYCKVCEIRKCGQERVLRIVLIVMNMLARNSTNSLVWHLKLKPILKKQGRLFRFAILNVESACY